MTFLNCCGHIENDDNNNNKTDAPPLQNIPSTNNRETVNKESNIDTNEHKENGEVQKNNIDKENPPLTPKRKNGHIKNEQHNLDPLAQLFHKISTSSSLNAEEKNRITELLPNYLIIYMDSQETRNANKENFTKKVKDLIELLNNNSTTFVKTICPRAEVTSPNIKTGQSSTEIKIT